MEKCKSTENKTMIQKIIGVVDFVSVSINKVSVFLVIASGTAMCFTLLAGVFSRYILGSAYLWTDEVGRMLMIFFTFIGASIAYQKNDLTNMAFLQNMLPPIGRKIVTILVSVVCISLFIMFGVQMIKSMPLYHKTIVVVTKVPQSLPACGIVYGSFAMVIHGISHFIKGIHDLVSSVRDK